MRFNVLHVLCVLCSLFSATGLFAFGNEGHRIVCHIAFLELNGSDQAEVARLTKKFERPDGRHEKKFEDSCLFADEARRKARAGKPGWTDFADFENWHFLNVPRTTRVADPDHCHDDCVLEGLKEDSELLRTGDDDQARAEGLIFLAHWVGDAHQPLHISFRDDLGGNEIPLSANSKYRQDSDDLHAVWDTGIIKAAMRKAHVSDALDYAEDLHSAISNGQRTQWLATPREQWLQESYDITLQPEVQYCQFKTTPSGERCRSIGGERTLTNDYQTKFQDDVELRLKQAGVRLAGEIRKALHP